MPTSRKSCPAPGCPAVIPRSTDHCLDHARPAFTQRYGSAHTTESRRWKRRIATGERVLCWRCGEPITNPAEMDLGHDDSDKTIVRGPEHAKCNRSTAGRMSHRD